MKTMRETVLYYTPEVTDRTARLKGIFVRLGIRIKNVGPDQAGELSLIHISAVFGVRQYFTYHQYTSYKTAWEKPVSEGGASGYAPFGSNVIKYTKDGVSYIDGQGKTVWMQSYEMKNPVISVNGGYAVIADVQGNQIAICSESGYQGTATTALPVIKAAVSQNGIVAAILEDSRASYICLLYTSKKSLIFSF